MMYRFLFLIFFVFFFVSCDSQNKYDILLDNISKNKEISSDVYHNVFSLDKKIIPFLIENIDIEKKGIVAFVNPMSSQLYSYMFDNQMGIRYAYLIEFILSKDQIESINGSSWTDSIKPYRIYHYGVIVKKNKDNEPILEPLSYNDMVLIKEIYAEWWEKNNEKTIEVLRKEWAEKGPILNGDYTWN